MLGQIFKAQTKGLRVKPTYDDIIDETFKPVNVKYPDRRAEATFNSHLFGQIRDAIDETETADQIARIKDLGMRRASAQSGQSFHTAAASNPPQPPPSPMIVDHHLERERFLQEEARAAEDAVREAARQRELTRQQTRDQLQYIANQNAAARQMHEERLSEMKDRHVAEIRQLQRHESNVSESIVLQERNAERTLGRQAEDNQMQEMFLARKLKYLQTREAEENQRQVTFLRGQLQDEQRQLQDEHRQLQDVDRQLQDEYRTLQDEYRTLQTLTMQVPLELRDEVSTELVAYNQALMGSSSSSSSASAAAAASSSSESVSTKAKTNTIKKTSLKASKSKMPQHTTKIEVGLSYDELEAKPRAYLLDQLDKRKVPLTISDRKSLSRDELAGLIVAADTDSTAALSMKLRKKLNKRTVDDQRKINAQNSMDV
jgi:hypothetical protein